MDQLGDAMMLRAITMGSCLLVSGCSSSQIQLTAAPDQQTLIRDGLPVLISEKKNIVMLRPNTRLLKGNERPAFTIVVLNREQQPETLFESQVTAVQTVKGKVTPIHVFSYAELVSEEETKQAVAAFGAALSGAARSMSAANSGYVTSTGSFNAYGANGGAYGTYASTTYDPLRAQLAQQSANSETQADFAHLRARGEQNLAALQQTILKDNTVMPGEWFGGSIVLKPPQQVSDGETGYSISVEFAGEQHMFAVSHVHSK